MRFLLKRKRFWIALIFLCGIVYVLSLFFQVTHKKNNTFTKSINGITLPAQTGKKYLQLFDKSNKPHDVLLKGVNIGMAKPGTFPGESSITKKEYLRWFKQIGAMNANVIRIYTIQPPAFYKAIADYNSKAKHPLYIFHGIWVNEEKMTSLGDVFDKDLTDEFVKHIQNTIDIVHGNANIPKKKGHASGKYNIDISKYVIGWVLGIEWDPTVVQRTNEQNKGMANFEGHFFRTVNSRPFEIWLAKAMNETATYETTLYSWQRPISFTNWVTSDLLSHPIHEFDEEDMVTVDPNLIQQKPEFHGGYFASYHVYPYYPDFFSYSTKYLDYIDFRGNKNSYSGYLHDLKKAHIMPIVIAEFGVPSSRGMTHRNIYGWNQGNLSEEEQGKINVHLFEDIQHEGMAGGIVFAWQDEWFKRTWNNMDLDNPDRRPYWSNAQTSEQQFGLLSFDPGDKNTPLYVDGNIDDWKKAKIKATPINASSLIQKNDKFDQERNIKQWFVTSDERYVYFRLDFEKDNESFDWSKIGAMILLDTIPDQGQHSLPGSSGLKSEAGIDFVIDLKGPNKSRIVVDSYYDPFYYQYGKINNFLPKVDSVDKINNGLFHKTILALNRPMDVIDRDKTYHVPFESYETGQLKFGNGNPNHIKFDSMTDISYNKKNHIVEVRIPWQLLNVKDPSKHEIIGDIWENGLDSSIEIPGIKMAIVTYRPDTHDLLGSRFLSYSTATIEDNELKAHDMFEYQWNDWHDPTYHERLKKSYFIMQKLFKNS